VPAVARLVTVVELRAGERDARTMSVSARHEAVLADGRRVLLLDDRGWTSAIRRSRPRADAPEEDPLDIWHAASAEQIERQARTVVGPDEPYAGRSREEVEAEHWAHLCELLRRQGVVAEPRDLRQLPHDVILGERLRARLRA